MSFEEIAALPAGARFYRCALQVNPFEYLARHGKASEYSNEADYNAAIVASCVANGVEVVGITDHYRISASTELVGALASAGISVFPGFEAVTKDGVHLLVLFDPGTPLNDVQGYIHACGIHGDVVGSPPGDLDAEELLTASRGWKAQVIAAHSTQSGGLFRVLAGNPRMRVFAHPDLNAYAIPGARSDIPDISVQRILQNTDSNYKRPREVAVINASDVCSPADFERPSSTTLIRMDRPTIEGLRQAFLDHESRIRLHSDLIPDGHPEILGLEIVSERFLKGLQLRLNQGLNVLIGGRGAGKSTIIECLRYALGLTPLGANAAAVHDAMISKVVCSGTKLTLHIQTHTPDKRRYTIERVVSQPPKVLDQDGHQVALSVQDLLGSVGVYGQSELAELAKDQTKLTELLERFVEDKKPDRTEVVEVSQRLAESRSRLSSISEEVSQLRARQEPLAGALETLARYGASGVEARLQEQSSVVKSEGLMALARARLQPIKGIASSLKSELPIEKEEFNVEHATEVAAPHSIAAIHTALLKIDRLLEIAAADVEQAVSAAEVDIAAAAQGVQMERERSAAAFEQALRELQRERIDGAEFIRLRAQVESLQPLSGQINRLEAQASSIKAKRLEDLASFRALSEARCLLLENTAKRLSKQLDENLRVKIERGMDRRNLVALLRGIGGRLAEAQAVLEGASNLDVEELATACREGVDAVSQKYGLTANQSARLCSAGEEFFMSLEEVELLPVTRIELNIAPPRTAAQWKVLDDLSVGQKSTALLYLLMLDGDAPLILDQPEDNLDNRFVTKSVVPMVRREKARRQLIFATHNANIPVLGDAEQIIAIDADGEAERGRILVQLDRIGSIDSQGVASEVRDLLEGGPAAFEDRRARYGF
ncbi:TrlF family AAA-like ATPase [Stenotrophomonas rhizophila]